MAGIDAVIVPSTGRRKKLLVADMESTMIENEMLDELADFLGLREKIAGITARAMNGEIDFEAALKARVELLKDLPVVTLDEAAKRITYMPGGATLIATMKQQGATCALVSGGFTYFTKMVRERLGFDSDQANVLNVAGRALAGPVDPMQEPITLAQMMKKRLVSMGLPGPTMRIHHPGLPVLGWFETTCWSPVRAWQIRIALLRSGFSVPCVM